MGLLLRKQRDAPHLLKHPLSENIPLLGAHLSLIPADTCQKIAFSRKVQTGKWMGILQSINCIFKQGPIEFESSYASRCASFNIFRLEPPNFPRTRKATWAMSSEVFLKVLHSACINSALTGWKINQFVVFFHAIRQICLKCKTFYNNPCISEC